jgi:hypothetical protein
VGCPGQLTRTTTIPHGPLDILQAQEQVRHRGGDRRAHRGSNPGWEEEKKKKKEARIMMVTHKFDHKNLAFFQTIFVVLPSQLTVLKSLFHHEDIAF